MSKPSEPGEQRNLEKTTQESAFAPELPQQFAEGELTRQETPAPDSSSLGDPSTPQRPSGRSGSDGPTPGPNAPFRPRYQPLRFHARGGLGEVLVARDEELNREVALKRIQDRHRSDPESRRRFLLEAEVTGRLDHPGVVPVHGLVQDAEGRPCYAMRFIEGETLKEAIHRYHTADRNRASADSLVFRQLLTRFVSVCNTIAFAHNRGILHRDLKPANIMLGQFGETLVVDWGLAKIRVGPSESAVSESQENSLPSLAHWPSPPSHTATGQILGTPAFMSPEQAEGQGTHVGPAADIYSLGATLYMLLTGRVPFDGDALAVLWKVRTGEFPPPRQVRKEVPAALEAVCLKAMATRPEDRYGSALELAADLERWLADEPVSARREPLHVRAGRWVKRHRALVTAGIGLMVMAVVFLAVIAAVMDQARQRSVQEQAQTDQQFRRAQINLGRAMRSVDQMLTRLGDERLAYLPQFDDDRREILRDALSMFRELLDANATEPAVQLETGKAYTRMGDINRLLANPTEALKAYEDAIALLGSLASQHPDLAEYQAALAHAHDQRAMLLWSDYEDRDALFKAEASFLRALPLWEQLTAAEPAKRQYQQALAMDDYRLACILVHTDRNAEGEAVFRKSLDLQKPLAQAGSADPKDLGALGSIYNSAGAHYLRQEAWAKAEEMYQKALPIFDKLAPAYPKAVKYQYELGYSLSSLGVIFIHTGRPAEAEEAYRRGMGVQERLAAAHPTVPGYQSELADNLEDWASVYENIGRLVEAEEQWRKVLAIRQKIAGDHPRNASYRRTLAQTYGKLGSVQARRRQLLAATESCLAALAIQEKLAQEYPENHSDQVGLAEACVNLANVVGLDKPADALATYAKALSLLEAARQRNPKDARARELWSKAARGRALALARRGDHVLATKEADDLERLESSPTGEAWYDLARVWALASEALGRDSQVTPGDRDASTERYTGRALALLTKAGTAGYVKDATTLEAIKKDVDLKSVSPLQAFQRLITEWEGKVSRGGK